MKQKLVAEALGTFVLVLLVISTLTANDLTLLTPVAAALVVGIFVYTIGPISGCHLNPAVTIGALSIQQITRPEAVRYIAAQIAGTAIAWVTAITFFGELTLGWTGESFGVFLAELIGTAVLTFGIAAVIYRQVPPAATGMVIGGSLLIGIMTAMQFGSGGVLNPAVMLVNGAFSLTYLLGTLAGGVLGMQLYRFLRTNNPA